MRQILTILWDSYRLLMAKKLFWVALGLSVFLAVIYASISIGRSEITIFFGAWSIELGDLFLFDEESASHLYLLLFSSVFVRFWLGGMAIALGLISVCSVFPDFMKAGSIDVVVSKPVSRVALFFTKYIGGLIFVGAQVLAFCLIVFFAIGFRTGEWVPSIFHAVWLIVFSFSLIYCTAVLTSVWTRSTLLSLLVAFLVWGVSWGVQVAESWIYTTTYTLAKLGVDMDFGEGTSEVTGTEREPESGMVKAHNIVKAVEAPLPKSREVTFLLKRKIVINGRSLAEPPEDMEHYAPNEIQNARAQYAHENRHSDLYILGTSFAFEVVILGLACFSFVRKDY